MKNVSKHNLRTCIHLQQKEFEEIIESLYPGAIAEPDVDCPWLINVDCDNEDLDYETVLEDLEKYFDVYISSYYAETGSDGAYDVWIDYEER